MGKRSNRRRRRREAYEASKQEGTFSNSPQKRAKTDEDTTIRPQSGTSEESKDSNRLKVSWHGKDEDTSVNVPPPWSMKDHEHTSQQQREVQEIWTYLGSKAKSDWVPSLIQQQMWPIMLQSLNVIGIAPTGSGKTYSYGIPTVLSCQKAATNDSDATGTLVLVPTRELVQQVSRV